MVRPNQPIVVLSEDTEREKGKDAQRNNINAAKAIADTVKATLGPKGMDKMLVDDLGDIIITNDGVTMLKEMDVEHPAAKMVIEVAETQDDECGDGTTSAVILAGELLKRSEDLLDKEVHPSTIAKGYRLAANKSEEVLEKIRQEIDIEDEKTLLNIATTAMTGKSIEMDKERLAEIAVDAVKKIATEKGGKYKANVNNIKIEKKAGSTIDKTRLINGVILDKERLHERMPTEVTDAKVALLTTPMEVEETETDAEITITDTDQMQEFLDREEESIKEMVNTLKNVGADVVLCQKGIDDLAQHYLAKEGILAIRRVKKSDIKKLSKALGANLVNNLKEIEEADLGEAGTVEEKLVAGSHMTFVKDVKEGKAVSILLRGGSEHVVDELERSINDALKVVAVAIEDGAILPGGGAATIELKKELEDYAGTIEGREQLAVSAFADALTVIPRTLSENAGLDGIDVLMELNAAHEGEDGMNHGINLETEKIEDMLDEKVVEPMRVKKQAIDSATEVTDMILLIDDVVASTGGEGEEGGPPAGGPGGMPGGMPGGGGMPPGM